jgi:hypothetical protein
LLKIIHNDTYFETNFFLLIDNKKFPAEIGGTMGMYLGATVITGFELVLFVCNLRRKKFCILEQQLDHLDFIHRRRAEASVIIMRNLADEENFDDV